MSFTVTFQPAQIYYEAGEENHQLPSVMFLILNPGSYVSLFVQGHWTRGKAIDPPESYVTQGASVAYTWVVMCSEQFSENN